MPPKLGESYGNLYVVHQDGSYAKLADIKEFDIGSSEPPEGYAIGGYVPYEEYVPPMIDHNCCTCTFSGTLHTITISKKRLYFAIAGLTKRQERLAIRRAERLRRTELKTGVRYPNRLARACMEITGRNTTS